MRTACGLSQAALAAELGVSQVALSKWERGLAAPRARQMVRIEALLARRPAKGARDGRMES